MNRIAAVIASLSLAFVGTSATIADTINVPGDQPTIAAAISASVNGDVINIDAGIYNEHSLNPNGKAITIRSASGNLDVTIDANGGGSVFVIDSGETSGTVIKDLIITGGSNNFGGGGGGISMRISSPTISGCTISGNEAVGIGTGGGIHCTDGSSPTITNCMIIDNSAYRGGGIYCNLHSHAVISGCTISGNEASDGGGICFASYSNSTISNCEISNNYASYGGGIYCVYQSSPTITNCMIIDNSAYEGGGIRCYDNSNATIGDSEVCGNTPDQIDGSYNDAGGNTVDDECHGESCADLNNSGVTDIEDLLLLIGYWGTSDGDCDADGDTDIEDLLYLIGSWGNSCTP